MLRFLQALRIVVALAIIAVAALPLVVAIDLVQGGQGWGLCPGRLSGCETSYFDGPELAAMLTLGLFGLVFLSRLLTLLIRRVERRRERRRVPPPRAMVRS